MRAWEQSIRNVTPYTPGEQTNRAEVIKLNTNENPYPPSPKVAEALLQIHTEDLRKYPDPEARKLTEAIAELERVRPEQVFVGAGSDEVLALCFLTFFHSEKPVLFPDLTYSFYEVWAKLFDIPFERVPLNDRFELVPGTYERANGGVIFPNPNAPTGLLLAPEEVEEILCKNPDSIVIVDEAYIDFGGTSCTALLKRYENLIVVKTFSKSRSMAGMRIGYALASETLVRYLKAVKNSFNSYPLNQTAITLGTAAAKDLSYFREKRDQLIRTRERAKKEFSSLGFTFPDSRANFLFVTHPRVPAETLYGVLKEAGILVRYFKKPRIDNYLRVTIGTDGEMERLYAFLRNYLGGTL